MDIDIAKEIVEKAYEMGYSEEEIELRESYSGRCMYGESEAAIVLDNPGLAYYIMGLLGHEYARLREDNMGRSQMVIY